MLHPFFLPENRVSILIFCQKYTSLVQLLCIFPQMCPAFWQSHFILVIYCFAFCCFYVLCIFNILTNILLNVNKKMLCWQIYFWMLTNIFVMPTNRFVYADKYNYFVVFASSSSSQRIPTCSSMTFSSLKLFATWQIIT